MRNLLIASLVLIAGASGAAAQFPDIPAGCREGDDAIAVCTRFLQSRNLKVEQRSFALVKRGDAHRAQRNPDSALKDYEAAIKVNPKAGLAYLQRGHLLRDRGDYDQALESYGASIKLQPFAIRYLYRAIVHRLKRDLDKALADLNTGIEVNPNEAQLFIERAIVHRLRNDFDRALADNNMAVKLAPDSAIAFRARGRTREERNELKLALADYRRAQALKPDGEWIARAIERVEGKLANPEQPKSAVSPDPKPEQPGKVPATAIGTSGQRVALVIGNSQYRNATALINPKNDAEAVGKALRNVGFSRVDLKLDLSRDQLAAALKEFAQAADKAEWAVIYFAGHGIEVRGNNYLVPVDARLASDRDVTFEAVTLEQVMQTVEGASKLRLVILDACRNNPFAKTMKKTFGSSSVGTGLGNIEPEGTTLVAYSARHGQTAEDGNGANSPFAASLVRNMQVPGLELNLVFRKVHDDVVATTVNKQKPFTYGQLPSENFFFVAK